MKHFYISLEECFRISFFRFHLLRLSLVHAIFIKMYLILNTRSVAALVLARQKTNFAGFQQK